MAPPAAPTGVSASSTNNRTAIRVSWDRNDDANIQRIGRRLQGGSGNWSQSSTFGNFTSWINSVGASRERRTYDVRVRHVNADGDSPWTTVTGAVTVLAWPRPSTVSTATVTPVAGNNTELFVDWDSISWVNTRYELRYRETGTDTYHTPNPNDFSSSEGTLTGLQPGTSYDVGIRGIGTGGSGSWSEDFVGITSLAVPTGLTLTESWDSISIAWDDDVTNADNYDLEWKLTSSADWALIEDIGSSPYTLDSLSPLTSYDIRIRSKNSVTQSEWSSAETVTTLIQPFKQISTVASFALPAFNLSVDKIPPEILQIQANSSQAPARSKVEVGIKEAIVLVNILTPPQNVEGGEEVELTAEVTKPGNLELDHEWFIQSE